MPTLLEQLRKERKVLSVSELTAQIKNLFESSFFGIWVQGEISNFRPHTSGHWYFSLKDAGATIRCVCFRMQNRLVRFRPEDGTTVRAIGRLSVYEPRGEYQLIVEYFEPVGFGALQQEFARLKEKLEKQGLFDQARKRKLPQLPNCVGVVTSPDGAAVRDILRVIRRRNNAVAVLIAPARVQGDGANREIARAIRMLNQRTEVDVIIVGRGGGSIEDLGSFNDESVARAIHESGVPVISAVGHETDFTIADYVADLRASTPSAAAEMVTAALEDICVRVDSLNHRVARAVRYRILGLRNELSRVESSRAYGLVPTRIRDAAQRFDDASYRIEGMVRRRLRELDQALEVRGRKLRQLDIKAGLLARRNRLDKLGVKLEEAERAFLAGARRTLAVAGAKLDSLSPLSVLTRGYAIAFDADGRIIKRASDVKYGDRLRIRVAEGEIDCTSN